METSDEINHKKDNLRKLKCINLSFYGDISK